MFLRLPETQMHYPPGSICPFASMPFYGLQGLQDVTTPCMLTKASRLCGATQALRLHSLKLMCGADDAVGAPSMHGQLRTCLSGGACCRALTVPSPPQKTQSH